MEGGERKGGSCLCLVFLKSKLEHQKDGKTFHPRFFISIVLYSYLFY
jgi:hypothetical protein